MKNPGTTTINQVTTYIIFGIFAAALGVITALTLPINDDLYYSLKVYDDFIFNDAPFPGLKPWIDFVYVHILKTNGRLGDKFLPLYLCLSPIVKGIIAAAVFYIIAIYTSRLTLGREAMQRLGSVAIGSCLVLFLPWYDGGFLSCMFINYEMSFALCLLWMWQFATPSRDKGVHAALILLLSTATGCWHEGFSIPLLIGAISTLVLCKEFRTRKTYMLTAGLALGVLLTLMCPGFWTRFGKEFGKSVFSWSDLAVGTLIPMAGVVTAVSLLCRDGRRAFTCPQYKPLLVSYLILTSVTAMIILKTDTRFFRAWWLVDGLSIILILRVARSLRMSAWIRRSGIALSAACALTNLSISIREQYNINNEASRIFAQYRTSPDGIVYCDRSATIDIPLATLRKVQQDVYTTLYLDSMRNDKASLHIVPREFRDIDALTLRELPGEGDQQFLLTPEGHILLRAEREDWYYTLKYYDDRKRERTIRVLCQKINSERYGALTYIEPAPHIWENVRHIARPLEVL